MLNVVIDEVKPSVVAGLITARGMANDKNFVAEVYPGTHKLESVKVEDTYVYVENRADAADVKFESADAEFLYEIQQAIKGKLSTISIR